MSIVKGVFTHVLSFIFITSTIFAITSYTSVTLFQRDNLTNFIKTEIASSFIDSQCSQLCSDPLIPESFRTTCINQCKQNITANLDPAVDSLINSVYNYKILGFITLNDLINFASSFTLFIFVTIGSGVALFVVAERPYKTLGWDLVYIGGSLIFTSLLPQILSSIFPQAGSTTEKLLSYVLQGSYLNYGIAIAVAGGVLVLLGGQKKK